MFCSDLAPSGKLRHISREVTSEIDLIKDPIRSNKRNCEHWLAINRTHQNGALHITLKQ